MSNSANSPIIFILNCVNDLNVIIFAVARLFKFQYIKREDNFMVLNINKTKLYSFNSAIHQISFTNMVFLEWAKKNLKKEQNLKFLNKSPRSNREMAKFSENNLLYDIN